MSLFGEEHTPESVYRVLARKYRPTSFETLIGQDALVRTLSNAIKTGRLAHAFLLTGIRGVGKTTTARIIARALNCIGEDSKGGPTIQPCGVCANCRMIAEDRHMDVLEMDAASRTGVNDVRELIETVHYAPTNARYKIYIIDEVHMLSNSAFNALLKTLEEPPPHVKFIFATTELRKIPVTILSRCQTFDLKRVDGEVLTCHLAKIAAKEGVQAEETALQLIAGAAEGSVRDSLSLLDQAIAHGTGEDGMSHIKTDMVRHMLGMADRSRSFRLLEQLLAGEIREALHSFKEQYHDGADPVYVLQELMELVHLTTRVKLVPELADSPELAEQERIYAKTLAEKLNVGLLTRAWQILSKGLQETRAAPNGYMAAEMVLIRLMHASSLPPPGEVIRTLRDGGALEGGQARTLPPSGGAGAPTSASVASGVSGTSLKMPQPAMNTPSAALRQPQPVPEATFPAPQNFEDVVALFQNRQEMLLASYLTQSVRLVSFQQGRIEVNVEASALGDSTGKIGALLTQWTGTRWVVIISSQAGQATLREQADAARMQKLEAAKRHSLVQTFVSQFPGAEVIDIVTRQPHIAHEVATDTNDDITE